MKGNNVQGWVGQAIAVLLIGVVLGFYLGRLSVSNKDYGLLLGYTSTSTLIVGDTFEMVDGALFELTSVVRTERYDTTKGEPVWDYALYGKEIEKEVE